MRLEILEVLAQIRKKGSIGATPVGFESDSANKETSSQGSATAPDTSWRSAGACRNADPAIFYSTGAYEVDVAKRICGDCPVQLQCLEFALSTRESEGIWGGATEKERRRIMRQRRNTARG